MRVLILTQYGMLAASSRTRVFQYLPLLQQQAISVRILTVLPDRGISGSQILVSRRTWRKLRYYAWASWRTWLCGLRLALLASRFELVFIQKVLLPAPLRGLLRRQSTPVLFDFDDAIFTTEVQRANWLAAWKLRRNAAALPAMLRLASRAVVENEYTGEFAARYGPVTTITGPIDTEGHQPLACRPDRDVVILGWIGSATTLPYLRLVARPLQRLAQRFPCLKLQVIGAPAVTMEGVDVEALPWSLEGEVEALQQFDVGLMPIPDDPWTRGKGGYKLLQYMAVGLPVVSSPVGINQHIVEDGITGFWARSEQDWEDRLERLITNPKLRHDMGRRGRATVVARYSLSGAAGVLVAAMRQTAGIS